MHCHLRSCAATGSALIVALGACRNTDRGMVIQRDRAEVEVAAPLDSLRIAIDRCTSFVANPRRLGNRGVTQVNIARECAPDFREPACQSAFLNADNFERTRLQLSIAQACTRAYCPKLVHERPPICEEIEVLDQLAPSELGAQWYAFLPLILKDDLGESAAQRVLAAFRSTEPSVAP